MRIHKFATSAIILALIVSGLLACSGSNIGISAGSKPAPAADPPPAVLQAKQAGTTVPASIVNADNGFGLSLLKQLVGNSSGNVAISPLSVSLVLQILYSGAGGEAQSAMQQTLGLEGLSADEVNLANAALQASLLDPDPVVTLTIANSLWTQPGEAISPDFIKINQTYYGAMLGDLTGAPQNVNDWVAMQTDGLITDILPPGNYQNASAVIANAIYFKGEWTESFDPTLTVPAPFTLSGASQVTVPMMNRRSGAYGIYEMGSAQLVRIPYGKGRMSMLILLPAAGIDIHAFLSSLTADSLTAWIAQLHDFDGPLSMPRFKSQFKSPLNAALLALGMGAAYHSPPCFPALAGSCLSDVEHATVVEVDEAGTIAAGSTTGTTTTEVPPTLTIDRPFVYGLHDDLTGEFLFLGVMQDPSTS
jgi:serpin B